MSYLKTLKQPYKTRCRVIAIYYTPRYVLTIIQFMMKISLIGLFLLTISVAGLNNCPNPTVIVPDTFLDGIFDTLFQATTYQTQLRSFITNPNMDTARTYITTQSFYLIPLWVFACLSLVVLIGFIVQLCCYNCCGVKKCGRRITLSSYTPTSVSCCVYFFMFFSVLLIAITIACFIITSDLLANLNDTTCDVNATYDYLYTGTPTGYTPSWSGANNFNSYAQSLSINFPNTMPTLNTLFQTTQYNNLVSTSSGSLYFNALTYACNSGLASTTVACPFADVNNCPSSSSTQIPAFSNNFCLNSSNSSSFSLIQGEQTTNTTAWKNSLVSLQQSISQATSNPVSFSNLVSQTQTLSGSIDNLKPGLASAIDGVNRNFEQAKIGSYTVLSVIIFLGVLAFLSSCCVFCTRNFNCRHLLYPLCTLFSLLSILFFLASSVLLFASYTTFNSCLTYNYYTTTPNSFQTISYYNSSQMTQILNTCFADPSNNIFATFNQTNLPTVEQIKNSYYSALPSTSFSTVVNTITNNLAGYAYNPNTVTLVGATTGQNPQDALNQLNGNTSSCGVSGSVFQYNPVSCNPNLVNQNSSSCYIINANTNVTLNCSNNLQNLQTFGTNIQTLASSYMNDAGLQNYLSAYFSYYEALRSFMNNNMQALFISFIQPYQNLLAGSSCSFLTQSLNSLVITSCNRDFPEMYAVSVLVTAMACCFFFMMILAYFLTTRLEFYAFLNGDLTNYDEDAIEDEEPTVQIQMADMTVTNRSNQQELLSPAKRR